MNILHKSLVPAAIGLAGLIAAALFMLSIPGSASAHTPFGYGPHAAGSTLAISINDSGTTAVSGAKVTAVSGSTITAQTLLGATALNWTVVTNANTKFRPRFGAATSTIASIAVGDYIGFSGSLDSAASGLTVDAKAVTDFSIVKTPLPKPVTDADGDIDNDASTTLKAHAGFQTFLDGFKNRFHLTFR